MTYGVNAPLGLVPYSYFGASGWNGSIQEYQITSAYSTNLFRGDLVTFASGLVVRYTASNTTGTIGTFIGCRYVDPQGIAHTSPYWPASQAVLAGTVPIAQVVSDPNVLYTIQSTGACVTTNIDYNADVTFATAGSTATGLSGMALNFSTIATTNTLPLRIIGFDNVPGNVSGVTYNNVIVKLNQSAFISGTTGV